MYDDELMQQSLVITFGTYKRCEISDIVFVNEYAHNKLHRLMNTTIFKQVANMRQHENAVYDIPLCSENPALAEVISYDAVICVWCDANTQHERIKLRDGFSDKKSSAIRKRT